MLKSRLCTQEQLQTVQYRDWMSKLKEPPRLHRKLWEYCFIAQALSEHGLLNPGSRGLGFGVGLEPLAALFAGFGCTVLATDQSVETARDAGWVASNEHATSLAALNQRELCEPGEFFQRVSFRTVDMNRIPDDLAGFDFTWSSCSFEHLGSIEAGLRFVRRSMDCLRPGGIAVHTTEFNLSSDSDTLSEGNTVLFRRRDIEALAADLRADGHRIELDFDPGTGELDRYVDLPPYLPEPHLKLRIGDFATTSIGLAIARSAP